MNEVPLDYDWPSYPERRKRLIDACEIIHRLWDGGFVNYDGHHWCVNSMQLYTRPEERVPLYIAGNGPKTTEVAGRYADGLLTIVDNDRYRDVLVPALEGGAESAGRNPDDIRRIKQLLVSYSDDYDEALESVGIWRGIPAVGFDKEVPDPREIESAGQKFPLEDMTDTWLVTTDSEEIKSELEAAHNVGFDEIEIHSSSPDQRTFINMMARDVLPHFR